MIREIISRRREVFLDLMCLTIGGSHVGRIRYVPDMDSARKKMRDDTIKKISSVTLTNHGRSLLLNKKIRSQEHREF